MFQHFELTRIMSGTLWNERQHQGPDRLCQHANLEDLRICISRRLRIFCPKATCFLGWDPTYPPQINGMQSFMVCGWFKSRFRKRRQTVFWKTSSGDLQRPPSQRCFTQHGYWILSQTFCWMFRELCDEVVYQGDVHGPMFQNHYFWGMNSKSLSGFHFCRFLFQTVAQMASEKHVRYRFLVTKLVEGDKLSADAMVLPPYTWV